MILLVLKVQGRQFLSTEAAFANESGGYRTSLYISVRKVGHVSIHSESLRDGPGVRFFSVSFVFFVLMGSVPIVPCRRLVQFLSLHQIRWTDGVTQDTTEQPEEDISHGGRKRERMRTHCLSKLAQFSK